MSDNVNRRGFLKKSIVAPTVALALSFEEMRMLLDSESIVLRESEKPNYDEE